MDYRDPDTLRELLRTANDVQIAKLCGVTRLTISNWRHRFGIARSTVPNYGSTLYSLNRSFFQIIDTPEKAYILGFIAADGCIHANGRNLSIAITESDVDHLYAIRDAMGGTNAVHTKTCSGGYQNGHRLAVLNLCGKELVRDLASLGLFPNKTFNLHYPTIPPHLESHFIRGLFEGDGNIGQKNFSLIGTAELLAGVKAAIQYHTGCLLMDVPAGGYARLVGYRRDRAALAWIYANASITLKRKYESWKTFWT